MSSTVRRTCTKTNNTYLETEYSTFSFSFSIFRRVTYGNYVASGITKIGVSMQLVPYVWLGTSVTAVTMVA